jgi:hypothetical protein
MTLIPADATSSSRLWRRSPPGCCCFPTSASRCGRESRTRGTAPASIASTSTRTRSATRAAGNGRGWTRIFGNQ